MTLLQTTIASANRRKGYAPTALDSKDPTLTKIVNYFKGFDATKIDPDFAYIVNTFTTLYKSTFSRATISTGNPIIDHGTALCDDKAILKQTAKEIILLRHMTDKDFKQAFGDKINKAAVVRELKKRFNRVVRRVNKEFSDKEKFSYRFIKLDDAILIKDNDDKIVNRIQYMLAETSNKKKEPKKILDEKAETDTRKKKAFRFAVAVGFLIMLSQTPLALGAAVGGWAVALALCSGLSNFILFWFFVKMTVRTLYVKGDFFDGLTKVWEFVLAAVAIAALLTGAAMGALGFEAQLMQLFGMTIGSASFWPFVYSGIVALGAAIGIACLLTLTIYSWIKYFATTSRADIWNTIKTSINDFYTRPEYLPGATRTQKTFHWLRHYLKCGIGTLLIPAGLVGGGIATVAWMRNQRGSSYNFLLLGLHWSVEASTQLAALLATAALFVQAPLNVDGLGRASVLFTKFTARFTIGVVHNIFYVISLQIFFELPQNWRSFKDNYWKAIRPYISWKPLIVILSFAAFMNGFGLGQAFEAAQLIDVAYLAFIFVGAASFGINLMQHLGLFAATPENNDLDNTNRDNAFVALQKFSQAATDALAVTATASTTTAAKPIAKGAASLTLFDANIYHKAEANLLTLKSGGFNSFDNIGNDDSRTLTVN